PTRRGWGATSTRKSSRATRARGTSRRRRRPTATRPTCRGPCGRTSTCRPASSAAFTSTRRNSVLIDRMRVFMTRDKDRPRVIVALDTDDGITGWGECYNHGPDMALPPLLDYLMGFLAGQDPRRVEHLTNYLVQQARFPPGALGLAAISAIDHCLWDITAKALGVPVYRLLGGQVRDRIKIYSGVYTAPDVPKAKEELDRLHAAWGFTAFKLSPWRIDMHANRW